MKVSIVNIIVNKKVDTMIYYLIVNKLIKIFSSNILYIYIMINSSFILILIF